MRFRSLLVPTELAVCLFVLACSNGQQPPPNPPNDNSGQPSPTQVSNNRPPETPGGSQDLPPKVNPEQLIDKITQLQHAHVRDSIGTQSGQCYTNIDLNKFKTNKTTAEIVGQLQKDKDFLAIVDSIKAMRSEERAKLLDRGLQTYRRTWAELGLDPATTSAAELRKGQTEAGQEAERLIAEAVVDLVRQKM